MIFELPINIGDVIYVVPSETIYQYNIVYGFEKNNNIISQIIDEIRINEHNWYVVAEMTGNSGYIYIEGDYNKNWFKDYDKAQERLMELKEKWTSKGGKYGKGFKYRF